MTTIPAPTNDPATWLTRLASADRPNVDWLPAARLAPGAPCSFCEPHTTPGPSTADLMFGAGHHRPAGDCCGLDAIHQLVGQHGRVTIVRPAVRT